MAIMRVSVTRATFTARMKSNRSKIDVRSRRLRKCSPSLSHSLTCSLARSLAPNVRSASRSPLLMEPSPSIGSTPQTSPDTRRTMIHNPPSSSPPNILILSHSSLRRNPLSLKHHTGFRDFDSRFPYYKGNAMFKITVSPLLPCSTIVT